MSIDDEPDINHSSAHYKICAICSRSSSESTGFCMTIGQSGSVGHLRKLLTVDVGADDQHRRLIVLLPDLPRKLPAVDLVGQQKGDIRVRVERLLCSHSHTGPL